MKLPRYILLTVTNPKGVEVKIERKELVTCKDCKNWKKTQIRTVNGEPIYDCPLMNGQWGDEDGYCYWGERREE